MTDHCLLLTPSRLLAALALAVLLLTQLGHAQDIEPRRWSHLPIGANFAGAAYAYTTGDIFLEQESMSSVDARVIYTFRPGLWLAASLGYGGGGATAVNGVASDNRQSNLGFGLGLGIPISRAVGVKIGYVGARTEVRTGLDTDTFTGAISIMW